jgi:general secretion pathway protein G
MRERGFTLIELLVVMTIIGMLLAVAVPRYFHSLERARETVLKRDLSVLRDAIDKYAADTGHYPEQLADLVTKKYVRALPVDPYTKSAQLWSPVPSEDENDPGVKDVKSGAPGAAPDGTLYASW